MPINKESVLPPAIGKIGPYTVFVTPPATPKPSEPVAPSPKKTLPVKPPPSPPVQAPPQQFHKPTDVSSPSNASMFDFFWDAVAKVQNAHSSLDDYVAHWFGLNQSKYQWALDDYYESKGTDQVDAKAKDESSKKQSV